MQLRPLCDHGVARKWPVGPLCHWEEGREVRIHTEAFDSTPFLFSKQIVSFLAQLIFKHFCEVGGEETISLCR